MSGAGLGSETGPVGFLPSSGPCGLQARVCAAERSTGQVWHAESRGVDGCMPAALPPRLLWMCSGTTGWPHKAGPHRALSVCLAVVPAEWGGHALGGSPFPPGGEGVRESTVTACSSPVTTERGIAGPGLQRPHLCDMHRPAGSTGRRKRWGYSAGRAVPCGSCPQLALMASSGLETGWVSGAWLRAGVGPGVRPWGLTNWKVHLWELQGGHVHAGLQLQCHKELCGV